MARWEASLCKIYGIRFAIIHCQVTYMSLALCCILCEFFRKENLRMKCPTCLKKDNLKKRGFYLRPSDQKKIQRYYCMSCRKWCSSQFWTHEYRLRKRDVSDLVFKLLGSGVSQRRIARMMRIKKEAVACRVLLFGRVSRIHIENYRNSRRDVKALVLDEMESFEHTKSKPITIPVLVEDKSRKILALAVGGIAASGNLAKISVKKYGKRKCERAQSLNLILSEVEPCLAKSGYIKSDMSSHYPRVIAKRLPQLKHRRYKGRKPKPSGLGELKLGGYDPLFSINHTFAMFRDNVKRLSRRTWCTTKRKERLEDLLYLYAVVHNWYLENQKIIPTLEEVFERK